MAQSDDGDVIDCVDMYHQPALIKRAPPEKNTEILQVHALLVFTDTCLFRQLIRRHYIPFYFLGSILQLICC
jgi:hypothetical protein